MHTEPQKNYNMRNRKMQVCSLFLKFGIEECESTLQSSRRKLGTKITLSKIELKR